jgi:hypothetical protein
MGYLNLDIREGSFDEIGASGTLDGMCGDYIPSWEYDGEAHTAVLLREHFEDQLKETEWNYEG